MNTFPFIFLACILAGFALISVPLTGFLAPVAPLAEVIGVLTVLLFAVVLIYRGVVALFTKKI